MTSSFFNKKYFLQSICFLLIIIVADHVSGHFLQYLYFSQKTGNKQNLNYSFADCKSDVIIFGSSRAQHHYDTKIFSDSLHMSCYNAGMDGGHSILLSYAQISVILKRYQPKLIIVEMSPEMVYHSVDYDKLKILLPYVKKYPELDSLTTLITPYESYYMLSAIYPFNSMLIDLIRFNTNIDANRGWIVNGYIPIKNKMINAEMLKNGIEEVSNAAVDNHKLTALNYIIDACKKRSIPLYLINSPEFIINRENTAVNSTSGKAVMNLIKNTQANFIDYSGDTAFLGKTDLFADVKHLNENGATRYSQKIASLLKKNLIGQ